MIWWQIGKKKKKLINCSKLHSWSWSSSYSCKGWSPLTQTCCVCPHPPPGKVLLSCYQPFSFPVPVWSRSCSCSHPGARPCCGTMGQGELWGPGQRCLVAACCENRGVGGAAVPFLLCSLLTCSPVPRRKNPNAGQDRRRSAPLWKVSHYSRSMTLVAGR